MSSKVRRFPRHNPLKGKTKKPPESGGFCAISIDWAGDCGLTRLERFRAKWKPVRVKKTRQIKNLEPRFDSIETEQALEPLGAVPAAIPIAVITVHTTHKAMVPPISAAEPAIHMRQNREAA